MIDREKVYRAALEAASSDGALDVSGVVIVHFDGESIFARRLTREWVDLKQLFARDADDDVSASAERALDVLWPECGKSDRRMFVTLIDMVKRFGGIGSIFGRKKR